MFRLSFLAAALVATALAIPRPQAPNIDKLSTDVFGPPPGTDTGNQNGGGDFSNQNGGGDFNNGGGGGGDFNSGGGNFNNGGGDFSNPNNNGGDFSNPNGGNTGGSDSDFDGGASQCTCVPYFLCDNGTVITDGANIIDIRYAAVLAATK